MHDVGADGFSAHRLKRASPHVQRDEGAVHAAPVEVGEQSRIEMQAGSGRCHGAVSAREYALVAHAVGGDRLTPDVRWQGHLAEALEKGKRGLG
jgi:hypothetical protein